MGKALKKYNKSAEKNIEDEIQSIAVVREHLDLIDNIFHKFNRDPYFNGTSLEQLQCLNQASEFVQITEKIELRFMGLAKRLKAAY